MHFVWHTIYAIASVRLGRYMIYLMVVLKHQDFWPLLKISSSWVTGKSLSEALIFALTNPQSDDRLFIELQVQYMKIPSSNLWRACCVQKLFRTFRTIFVLPMFWKEKSFWQRFTCTQSKFIEFMNAKSQELSLVFFRLRI